MDTERERAEIEMTQQDTAENKTAGNREDSIRREYGFASDVKLKECRYCCVMIPKKAKVCPNCRMNLKRHWFRNLVAVVFAVAVIGVGGYYLSEHWGIMKDAVASVWRAQDGAAVPVVSVTTVDNTKMASGAASMETSEVASLSDAESEPEAVKESTGSRNGTGNVSEASADETDAAERNTASESADAGESDTASESDKAGKNGTASESDKAGKSDTASESDKAGKDGTAAESADAGESGTAAESDKAEESDTAAESDKAGESDSAAERKASAGTTLGAASADTSKESQQEKAADRQSRQAAAADEDDALAAAEDVLTEEAERNPGSTEYAGTVKDMDEQEQAFREECIAVGYKSLLRNVKAYADTALIVEVEVVCQVNGGLFDDNIYYLCETEDENNITRYYIIRDDRETDDTLILEGDILTVYGRLFGSCKIPADLIGTRPTVPAVSMLYYDLTDE